MDELNWDEAKKNVDEFKKLYKEIPYQSAWFALGVIERLEKRFDSGERTADLHKSMMSVE